VQSTKSLAQIILSLEPLAYYFGMLPDQFWNGRYKEIYLFCSMNVIKMKDDFKRQIQIQEAATNKLIMADSMSNERPKLVTIESMFKGLFKK
jgi:hypothetical protein